MSGAEFNPTTLPGVYGEDFMVPQFVTFTLYNFFCININILKVSIIQIELRTIYREFHLKCMTISIPHC